MNDHSANQCLVRSYQHLTCLNKCSQFKAGCGWSGVRCATYSQQLSYQSHPLWQKLKHIYSRNSISQNNILQNSRFNEQILIPLQVPIWFSFNKLEIMKLILWCVLILPFLEKVRGKKAISTVLQRMSQSLLLVCQHQNCEAHHSYFHGTAQKHL